MKYRWLLVLILLFIALGCKKHSEVPPTPGPGPGPIDPPLTEELVGKLFYHDIDLASNQYDVYMADLYVVPKAATLQELEDDMEMQAIKLSSLDKNMSSIQPGITTLHNIRFGNSTKERAVLKVSRPFAAFDITKYDFVLKNKVVLTTPSADDYAVTVNNNNWITYVSDVDMRFNGNTGAEIVYMNLADRIPHQLTPINGQYQHNNADPDWKTDDTIVWVHESRIVEVNIFTLGTPTAVIPELDQMQFDPNYSPDRSMMLFNTWYKRKKNSFIKYVDTGVLTPVLPQDYYTAYKDDNPTWVFSNTFITGHIFMENRGRLYNRNLATGNFQIITDGQQDFRYVTPISFKNEIYYAFSDWSNGERPSLWICKQDGSLLRELNQTGDECVFMMLGLPAPYSDETREQVARIYAAKFQH